MTAIFITATGTDIGKTFVTAGLARALRQRGRAVEALKPLISGFDPVALAASDTGILLAAAGLPVDLPGADRVSPWRFRAPLSPDMAARREGRAIDFEALTQFCRAKVAHRRDALLIEGVGGVMVPLDDRHTVLDWMAALGLPVLLVTGSYLGAISHTLTALDALIRRGLVVKRIVVSETPGSTVDLNETARTIERFTDAPVSILPRLAAGATLDAIAALL
jgi:dethiobiotin synthetase